MVAAIAAGLIPNSVEASEPYLPDNLPSTSIVRTVQSIRAGFKEGKSIFTELPTCPTFTYDLNQGNSLKKLSEAVWNNPEAKKEIITLLKKYDNGQIAPRNQKKLQGFKKLIELKGSKTRVIVYLEQGEAPQVVGFCMRRDLDKTAEKFQGKFN